VLLLGLRLKIKSNANKKIDIKEMNPNRGKGTFLCGI